MQKVQIKAITVMLLMLLLSILTQGCAGVRPDVDLSTVSVADEVAYGKLVNPFVLQRLGALSQDDTIQAYLAEVGMKLETDTQNYSFTFVNDPAPAAFALPAGKIVVTRGLLYHLETENELVVMLAHLVGHDRARDGLQLALLQHPVPDSVDVLALPSVYDAAAVSARLLTAAFSEEQEIVADRYAAAILSASGFDPALLTGLLPSIYARLDKLPDFKSGVMTRQHPLSSRRLKAASADLKTISSTEAEPYDSGSIAFVEIKSALSATRPAYELYQQARKAEHQGEIDQAIDLYMQAVIAAPEEGLILTGLGMVYMRQDVLVSARQHLTRAVRVDSYYYYSQLGLGYIYLQQKDFIRAARRLRRSQTLLPTAQGGYLLARVFDEAGNRQAALTVYRDVVRYFEETRMGTLAAKRIKELE